MKHFIVEFTEKAEAQVEDIVFRMMGRNPNYAERWRDGLEQAAVSLETFPRRCPFAHENDTFPYEVRQLLYASHRILFTLIDGDGDGEDDTVRILHVRHQAQRWLDEEDKAE